MTDQELTLQATSETRRLDLSAQANSNRAWPPSSADE
jgi:hypothetical protein